MYDIHIPGLANLVSAMLENLVDIGDFHSMLQCPLIMLNVNKLAESRAVVIVCIASTRLSLIYHEVCTERMAFVLNSKLLAGDSDTASCS